MIPSIKIPFALSLVLAFAVSAHATLVPGSEKAVTTPVLDVAAFDQAAGQMASDGDSFLAVWISHTIGGSGDIHGSRVSPNGTRVDDEVLGIAATDAHEDRLAITFSGNRYFVVWSTPTALRGRFVGRDAAMSDVFEIAALTNGLVQPQVAFNGNRLLVVWSAPPTFRGVLVELDGTIVKTFDIAPTAQILAETALVAANGKFHFVTALTDFNGVPVDGNGFPADIGVRAIDNDGIVGERTVIAPATKPVFDLRATSTATEFLVGWSSARGIPGGTVRSVRVTASGAGAVDIAPADGMYVQDVTPSGSGFLVLYGTTTVKLVHHPGAGTPVGLLPIPLGDSLVLDAASNGTHTFALLRGAPRPGFTFGPAGGDLDIVSLGTQTLEPLAVTPRHQSSPDIAAAGDVQLAVWCEYIGSDRRLGVVANGLDLGADVFHPTVPRVASNGTDWLVVWVDAKNLYGSRVAHNGTKIDATPFLIASDIFENSELAVSWDGTQYVVIFFRGIFFRGRQASVRAARIPAQGAVTLPELLISPDTGSLPGPANDYPAIASSPAGSLVVWRAGQGPPLQGALLSPGGTVTPLSFPMLNPGPRPSVAWNHGTFLVAAPYFGLFGGQIQWHLVNAAGVITTPLSTFVNVDATPIPDHGYPTVAVEPYLDGFMLFWNGVPADALSRTASIFAARIDGGGILADGPRFVSEALVDSMPGIGASGNTVVYARKIGHATRELARVFTRDVQYVAGKPRRRAVR